MPGAKEPLALVLAAAAAVGAGALWVLLRRRRPAAAAPGVTIVPKYGSLATNGDPDEFSVLTFNILADVFAQRDAAACSESGVIYSWQHRWPLIEKTIAAAGADVVLLQEVDVARLPEVLASPACSCYTATTQDTQHREYVCVTLAAPRLQLWWKHARSRVLLSAYLFEDSAGATQALYVANLHLEGHPRKPHERITQLKNALLALQHHQSGAGLPPEACNLVIGGDFNSTPDESAWQLLASGQLEAGAAERGVQVTDTHLSHPYLLREVYFHAAAAPLPFTRQVPHSACTLDYLWAAAHLNVTAVLHPICAADRHRSYPNAHNPSDHVPLGAKLRCLPAL